MRVHSGFIAIEALVGVFISITSCLILVMAFQNMNNFLIQQHDKLNAHLAFIELKESNRDSMRISGFRYQVAENNNRYIVKNLTKGTKFKIEKK